MNQRKILAMCSACLLALSAGPHVQAGHAHVDTTDAYWWWFEHAGTAKIVRTNNGISGNISVNLASATDDAQGLTITLWVVIFNNPGECAVPNACGDNIDFANPAVMPDVVYGGGNVVGASGWATIGFHRRAGDNTGSISDLFFLPTDNGDGFGLRNPRGAEVHYVIRFHGPRNQAAMPEQIQSYPGGCVDFAPYGFPFPQGPDDLYTGPGQCQDVIFAIHSPPQ